VFARTHDGQDTSAKEVQRGFRKEGEELRKGAKAFAKTLGGANLFGTAGMAGNDEIEESVRRKYRFRVSNTWSPNSQGVKYLEAALAARDSVSTEEVNEASSTNDTPSTESLMNLLSSRSGSSKRQGAAEGKTSSTIS
jgi:hypothetical protein